MAVSSCGQDVFLIAIPWETDSPGHSGTTEKPSAYYQRQVVRDHIGAAEAGKHNPCNAIVALLPQVPEACTIPHWEIFSVQGPAPLACGTECQPISVATLRTNVASCSNTLHAFTSSFNLM